jgi:3-hydroxyisobutyrate dehydrogenase-like beta-hydroxyacid dehydrogenase
MLPKTEHVQHVFNNPSTGLLLGSKPGTLFIDSSTIDPNGSRDIAAKVQAKQVRHFMKRRCL